MKRSLARWLLLPLGFLMLGIVGSLILQKRTVAQNIPGGGRARLIFPIYWTQAYGSTVLLEGETGRRAELFYGLFEMPRMLLPGQRPSTVICIYMFDVRYAVFVFDMKGQWYPHAPVRGEEGFDIRSRARRSRFERPTPMSSGMPWQPFAPCPRARRGDASGHSSVAGARRRQPCRDGTGTSALGDSASNSSLRVGRAGATSPR
jgi:hypothetical protein